MNFSTSNNFREMVTFAVLTGQNISINKPEKFTSSELKFLDLISFVTKNTKIYITNKKCKLDLKPGSIECDHGEDDVFDCGSSRAISYFVEPLIVLGLFSKNQIELKLKGITNDNIDLSIDLMRNALAPMLKEYYSDTVSMDIKVLQRGFRPGANGLVSFRVGAIKKYLPALKLLNTKKLIKRIRGNALAGKVSSQFLGRIISTVRDQFNDYIPDVWVYSELIKNSPDRFYGVSLYTNNFLVSEYFYDETVEQDAISPEEVSKIAVNRLLDEIEKASELCSTSFQSLILTLMALGDKDVNAIVMGRLSDYSIWTLRLLKKFFNVEFKFKDHVKENSTTNYVIASCVGCKLHNRNTELN